MIKFHLIVGEMLPTVLAGVIISSDDAHFHPEWDVATSPAFRRSLRRCLGCKEDGAHVTVDVAHCIVKDRWDAIRVLGRVKFFNLFTEPSRSGGFDRGSVVDHSCFKR